MPKYKNVICKHENCDKCPEAHGLCHTHYGVANRAGLLPNSKQCSVEDCAKFAFGRGLCTTHYRQFRLTVTDKDKCVECNCDRPQYAKSYCRKHYEKYCDREGCLRRSKKYQKENPKGIVITALRKRLRNILKLKNRTKKGSHIKWLGCTAQELVIHLESLFQAGMTWDNYGEWHIDHIKPISLLNPDDPESYKELCHYANLQPLWAIENIKKSNKF